MNSTSLQLDSLLYAMSDGTRRQVLEHLSRGPASVSELAAPFEMAMPSFMQHLNVLEQSGLIRSQKMGRVRTCSLEPKALKPVENWLHEQRSRWEKRLDQLDSYLLNLHKKEKK